MKMIYISTSTQLHIARIRLTVPFTKFHVWFAASVSRLIHCSRVSSDRIKSRSIYCFTNSWIAAGR